VNNFNLVRAPSSFPTGESNLQPTILKEELNRIDKAQALLHKAEQYLVASDNAPAELGTLSRIVAQQQQVALTMSGSDTERRISMKLAESIAGNAKKLENIQAWTIGGKTVIPLLLNSIAESIFKGGVKNTEFEDLVQIMALDMLVNGKHNPDFDSKARYFIDATGSGSHAPSLTFTPQEFGEMMTEIYNKALTSDKNSLAYKTAKRIDDNYRTEFNKYNLDFAANYWTNPDGFMDGYKSIGQSKYLSPIMKLNIIAALSAKGALKAEDYLIIATSDLATIRKTANITGRTIDWEKG
jgi:hypothetical protein